jgi:hypothetical protein
MRGWIPLGVCDFGAGAPVDAYLNLLVETNSGET